ncbi:MAG: hypothetical protein Ct9H90mP9_4900 [Pseudomonadota bacterium]|nr:MAG: hypothetical protein Ct9H90mP9_4900 [Pseudomonadota bacterium]
METESAFSGFRIISTFIIADCRLDGVFGEHRTVDFNRGQRKFFHDFRVLNRHRLINALSLDPFGGKT